MLTKEFIHIFNEKVINEVMEATVIATADTPATSAEMPIATSLRTSGRSPRKKSTKEETTKKKQDKKLVKRQQQLKKVIDGEGEMEEVQMETCGIEFSLLPPYIPLRKPNSKPVKKLKDVKYDTFTPLLREKVPFSGEVLGKIPHLKFADYNFNDRKKYPHFTPNRYLKQVII